MEVEIYFTTNILKLSVSYIAIDPEFPHKINSFDNVPINYPNEPLVNVSVEDPNPTYYYNTVNYTEQAQEQGYDFDEFAEPLSNNKIILFMTSFSIDGPNPCNTPRNRVNVYVNAEVLTVDTYLFSVQF